MDFNAPNILPPPHPVIECGKCEELPGIVPCDCGEYFCEQCHRKHLIRNKTHRRKPDQRFYTFWSRVTDVISGNGDNESSLFKEDETAKWFGLDTKARPAGSRVSVIVDTQRLAELAESSVYRYSNSPQRQFPSITSFIGFTGAGKSALVRSLIYHSATDEELGVSDVPVPSATSGAGSLRSTSGEVNLYAEPSSFGTTSPIFFADCEGIMASEPIASQHQKDWTKSGQKYRIQIPMDRRTVVKKIYPRFLYIVSDVVCYVTRDNKSWADTAVRLLEWSSIGAATTANQKTLPALIIILNAPIVENEDWMSDDTNAATRDFFHVIERELEANDDFRSLALKYGTSSVLEIFKRSYSSIYVHYIPLQGKGRLGGVDLFHRQTKRLLDRIRADTGRVQGDRARSLTRFDTKQLLDVIDLAFKHVATGTDEPFDFGQGSLLKEVPESLASLFGEYIRHCFKSSINLGLSTCVSTLGSTILANALAAKDERTILTPVVVFNAEIREACQNAMDSYRDENVTCAFIDRESGFRCASTKSNHERGHRSQDGTFIRNGGYAEEKGSLTTAQFISSIEGHISALMHQFSDKGSSKRKIWRQLCTNEHRKNIEKLRSIGVYPKPGRAEASDPFSSTTTCYGCIFRQSEYLLPCGHTICEICAKANSAAGDRMKYTHEYTLESCVICGTSTGPGWPFAIKIRPPLSGLRILSLDGGGVRGIIQLTLLERLESRIGLRLPIGYFFDLIVGTSTGGVVALSLGAQGDSVENFIEEFKNICKKGFSGRLENTNRVSSFIQWWRLYTLYFTQNYEEALENYFPKENSKVFGLRKHCRVAITTTISGPDWSRGPDAKVISNYNRGGAGKYLSSDLSLSDAARCTSAARPYFDPKKHAKQICYDGGLKVSNPVHLAMAESKSIWGGRSNYDMILSVGPGFASQMQPDLASYRLLERGSLFNLFPSFLGQMNGEEEWMRFRASSTERINERSSRLNVFLTDKFEPSFDDIGKMEKMEADAKDFTAFENELNKSPFSPIDGQSELQVLDTLADRLRATLFFLEVKSIDKSDGFLVVVKAVIRCRLGPGDAGFAELLPMVYFFRVNGEKIMIDTSSEGYINVDVELSHESLDEAIRVDVNFGNSHWVAISGCPITIKEIMEHWDPVAAQDGAEIGEASTSDGNAMGSPAPPFTSGPGAAPRMESYVNDYLEGLAEASTYEDSVSGTDIHTLRTDDGSEFSFDVYSHA
ncbi:hypothetical protein TWF718_010203 [Orbilia javanica]|uniref:PNPLA domain-containing protein n=1 Tax=Orbilia javanica TaxID=47235 RepID=A0AAN8RKS8_9PEZI